MSVTTWKARVMKAFRGKTRFECVLLYTVNSMCVDISCGEVYG
jgi:hypothetical protein